MQLLILPKGGLYMKIKHVNLNVISIPTSILKSKYPVGNSVRVHKSWDFIIVNITTSNGVRGMGYVWTPAYGTKTIYDFVQNELKGIIVNQDAQYSEFIWNKMWKATNYYGRKGLAILGISMIDMALWDIKSKLASMPLHKYLGGFSNKIPVYATDGFLSFTLYELQERVENRVEEGYKAIKLFVGNDDIKKDVERIKLTRNIIGNDIQLMIDANQAWKDIGTASRNIQYFKEFDISWIEEPLPADNVYGYQKLSDKSEIPIAGGENAYTIHEAFQYLNQNKVGIFQPDIFRIGGITGLTKAMTLAESHHIPVSPHLATEISLPVMATSSNVKWAEYMPLFDDILNIFVDHQVIRNGYIYVSNNPGHGVEFNSKIIDNYSLF